MVDNIFLVFISLLLESIPFILIGSIISSLIQMFVSEELIRRIIPKNIFLALIITSFTGMIFPVCECAIIPIGKRLIKKGVPLPVAVTFMLSVPIVNPIVIMSTYYAFSNNSVIFSMRIVFGIVNSIIIGYLIHINYKNKQLPIREDVNKDKYICNCGCEDLNFNNYSKMRVLLNHTKSEFFSVLKYLIFGSLISSLFKVTVKGEVLTYFSKNLVLSVIIMIILALLLSVCSEADAFIASTFALTFTKGSVIAFLVLGPMLDIKNILMLLGNFKKEFVIKLSIYIILVTFVSSVLFNIIGGV